MNFLGPCPLPLFTSFNSATDLEAGSVRFENGELAVIVSQNRAKIWANAVQEVGLYLNLELAGGKTLRIAVEKDFQCIDGPPEERDLAGYPNPLAKLGCKTEKR